MGKHKAKTHTVLVSDSFGNTKPAGTYESAFRRWLVQEIGAGRQTIPEAIKQFGLDPVNGTKLVKSWCDRYAGAIRLTLPVMTEKERVKVEGLQKRVKELEKQLEFSQMKNLALNVLIDIAEEDLKIKIRKKPGPKQ